MGETNSEEVKPVLKQLKRLEDLLDSLQCSISELEEKIEPVLTPETPNDPLTGGLKSPEELQSQCFLAERIHQAGRQALRQIERLNRLSNRIEL